MTWETRRGGRKERMIDHEFEVVRILDTDARLDTIQTTSSCGIEVLPDLCEAECFRLSVSSPGTANTSNLYRRVYFLFIQFIQVSKIAQVIHA